MIDRAAIRLVLDQGVPRDAASELRDLGFECIHVSEVGMRTAKGDEVLAFALRAHATVLTLDADFHAILAVSQRTGPSVIRLRMEGLRAEAVVEVVQQVVEKFGDDLALGSLVTVKARKTTCHRLPIGGPG